MLEIVIVILVLIIFIAPFSLLFHEIGHVVGAKLMAASKILLTIGVGKRIFSITFQNIDIHFRRFFLVNSFTSTVRDEPFTNTEKIIITFMGPLFSSILAFIAFGLYYSIYSSIYVYLLFLFNLWLVFINLIPFKIGEKQSDGYMILQMVLQKLRK